GVEALGVGAKPRAAVPHHDQVSVGVRVEVRRLGQGAAHDGEVASLLVSVPVEARAEDPKPRIRRDLALPDHDEAAVGKYRHRRMALFVVGLLVYPEGRPLGCPRRVVTTTEDPPATLVPKRYALPDHDHGAIRGHGDGRLLLGPHGG